MVKGSVKRGFLDATVTAAQGGITRELRKVSCPVCLSMIILESITSGGDVIFCPHCEVKLIVSSFNKKPTVHSINLEQWHNIKKKLGRD